MKYFIIFMALFGTVAAFADTCDTKSGLKQFSQASLDPEVRGELAGCLIRNHLGNSVVAQAMLKSLLQEEEHVFVKEDILQALAQVPFRRNIKVDQPLGSELSKQEAHAVDRTLASAKGLLDVTKAVKSMNEVLPLTKYEADFVVALSNYVSDSKTDIMIRIAAVQALSNITHTMVDSGIYDEKVLLTVYETFQKTALQDDNASYFSGAPSAFRKLQTLFQRYAVNIKVGAKQGRHISSVPGKTSL